MYGMSPASSGRSLDRSAASRNGWPTTGPTPGLMSTSTPTARNGTTMSLNRIAASTSYLRSGCMVISVTSSGRVHESSIEMPSRTRRYSGSDRPAWRMNQTGVNGTGSLRQARIKGEFNWGAVTNGSSHSPVGPSDTPPQIRGKRVRTCQDRDEFRHVLYGMGGPCGNTAGAWELPRVWWRRALRADPPRRVPGRRRRLPGVGVHRVRRGRHHGNHLRRGNL